MKTNKKMATCPWKKAKLIRKWSDILYKSTRFLLKATVFLSFLERSGANPALQNVETRVAAGRPCHSGQDARAPSAVPVVYSRA